MKKKLIYAGMLVILVLDFMALDDITTGNEPDYYLEYAILGISVVVLPFLFLIIRKIK